MYYIYTQNKDTINKFKVSFDEKDLIKLMNEIIDNCSHISHQIVVWGQGYFGLDGPDERFVRNLEFDVIDRKYDRDGDEQCTIRYEYDEYTPPKLVDIIYKIWRGECNPVDLLKSYDPKKELTLQSQLNKLLKEIGKCGNDTEELNRKLDLIEKLRKDQELNKNQVSTEEYYKRLVFLVNVELVATYDISTIKEVLSFLNLNIGDSDVFDQDDSYVRILKRG